ncbi:hypothetical protein [Paenibacillus lutimineralis]|uniref:Uncharacterized protein n=1 Tax=Paenibacillus lutimineralis TaxID=2707005 RepID=A0A3S9UWF7_9BACL|nr:hypothetical protein [Paenibacillus lutimineralis]AZS14668.1 hypothetical protein EI981_09510 [Paenibacillus lutimineralis]
MKEVIIRHGGDYLPIEDIDFSIIANDLRSLLFYRDDIFLGMQAMNIGIIDPNITQFEYNLLETYIEKERTPSFEAMTVGAFSQMWIFALYEVLRLWRDRKYDFSKLFKNGGIELKLKSLADNEDHMNLTLHARRRQLEKFRDDQFFRDEVEYCWVQLEPVYKLVELYRMNMAKHAAPGKSNAIPIAPGYGRINSLCGALDYELLLDRDSYELLNRRNVADNLREALLVIRANKK